MPLRSSKSSNASRRARRWRCCWTVRRRPPRSPWNYLDGPFAPPLRRGGWHGPWCLVLVWSLVFGVWCFPARAADTNAVLNGWLSSQTNLQTWTADFVQTRTFRTLTQPLVATGHVWFATPNRFRWELGSPART